MQCENIQEMHRKALIAETISGQTKLDTLSGSTQSISGEAEAMYFKLIRDFFKNEFFRSIISD